MKKATHNLSHYKLLTANMGSLIPIGCQEVLPGDHFKHSTSALVRCAPLLAPVMHPINVRIHHWFIPHRLVWNDWESFITGGEDGADASTFPTIDLSGGISSGTLADYLGIPKGVNESVSALPFRAYALIYNEWYRNQDLQTALTIDKTDGADSTTNTTLQSVTWGKDFFTSASPDTQKGSEVNLPLGTEAPVLGIGTGNQTYSASSTNVYETDGTGTTSYANYKGPLDTTSGDDHAYLEQDPNNTGFPWIRADLSNASAATINP